MVWLARGRQGAAAVAPILSAVGGSAEDGGGANVVLAPAPPPLAGIFCANNADATANPDVVCGGSYYHLNQLKPNAASIEARSPECCCKCVPTRGESMNASCVSTQNPDPTVENSCTEIMRHRFQGETFQALADRVDAGTSAQELCMGHLREGGTRGAREYQ